MKKSTGPLTAIILFISVLLNTSCEKLEQLTEITFGYTYKQDTFPIPAISSTGDIDLSVKLINTNINDILSDNGITKDRFKSAYIKSINLELVDTTTIYNPLDFDFVSKINVYIEADGKAKKLIASKDPVPSATNSFSLEMANIDLVDYFGKNNVTITLNGTVVSPTDHAAMLVPTIRVEFTGDIIEN